MGGFSLFLCAGPHRGILNGNLGLPGPAESTIIEVIGEESDLKEGSDMTADTAYFLSLIHI